MKLYQFDYSPFAAKVRTCLALKKLSVERVDVPYLQRAELLKVSGGIQVPVLVDGSLVISDSARIVDYLEEMGGIALRVNPLSVALEQWADEYFQEIAFRLACPGLEDAMGERQGDEARLMFRLVKERRYGVGCVAKWRDEEAQHSEATRVALQPIVSAVRQQRWGFGVMPTAADAAIAGQLHMVEHAKPGWVRKNVPALSDWFEQLRAR